MRTGIAIAALALISLVGLSACASKEDSGIKPDTVLRGTYGPRTTYRGESVSSLEAGVESSTVIADGKGGVILIPGVPYGEDRNPNYTDARELKLKMRELAEQLVANMEDCSLKGAVALPTSFVSLNDFNETSAFGRLVSEQLFHELNQRGYPVREYRIPGSVRVKKEGEFFLSRELGNVNAKSSVVIVGTYSPTPDAVFVNARLVRPKDGRVLRTANLVLENNPTLARMLRMSGGTHKASSGSLRIRDYETAVRPPAPASASPFDQGEDIH